MTFRQKVERWSFEKYGHVDIDRAARDLLKSKRVEEIAKDFGVTSRTVHYFFGSVNLGSSSIIEWDTRARDLGYKDFMQFVVKNGGISIKDGAKLFGVAPGTFRWKLKATVDRFRARERA